mgnify:FL=1
MNNKICNKKVEVSKGIEMNDKDYINSLLSTLKDMEKNYVIAMEEASCEELYNKHKQVFDAISSLQREVYEFMFRKGWYFIEEADANKINQKYEMLNQEYNDLNS